MFNKILIANRGEIALRIIRACHELGISTVAVYSTADELALHVRFATEAVCIGPPESSRSYLHIPAIMSAAELTNADAIHPGYGFLAENAEFAGICEDHGITFLGPRSETIRLMGDKSAARETMMKAGVPVTPGTQGVIHNVQDAVREAEGLGYPVMVKASAGGGGRGMRRVETPDLLPEAFVQAQNEAQSAFGNGDLYVEKFISEPRHIEVQVMGGPDGKAVALGERECSIQRRNQKLIEESPSPVVDDKLRRKLCDAAVQAAEQVGYLGAGTVEFLLDNEQNFYFMEMNTRIQVEHPVTEMVYGIDLLKTQIGVHAGISVPAWVAKAQLRGHAIECRINAEDPLHDFRPAPGLITSFHVPGGMGVRVDTAAYAGYHVQPHYDSMIAKLIVHGTTRESAINRTQQALEEFVIEGIPTTIPFHQQVLADPDFRSGRFTTAFLESFQYQPSEEPA
ncbi:MAG: acetyl-CoA carboxylase biotin carboxylase subunit [Fidelibacterota bacterium]|nr:MAG: acetyl-CoA carboxylase biotin carboxylase subunit [Candidatus Neomarinimicrobiota bacterium]